MIGGGRPMRTCVACGQTDDHPRHSVLVGDAWAEYHLDCHALMSPPCQECKARVTGRPPHAIGADLLKHLLDQSSTVTVEQGK